MTQHSKANVPAPEALHRGFAPLGLQVALLSSKATVKLRLDMAKPWLKSCNPRLALLDLHIALEVRHRDLPTRH